MSPIVLLVAAGGILLAVKKRPAPVAGSRVAGLVGPATGGILGAINATGGGVAVQRPPTSSGNFLDDLAPVFTGLGGKVATGLGNWLGDVIGGNSDKPAEPGDWSQYGTVP